MSNPRAAGDLRQGDVRLDAKRLEHWCAEAFERVAVPRDAASVAASVIVRTSLRGVDTHGVHVMPTYLKRLVTGGLNPKADITVLRETPATAVLAGNGGLGQFVMARATQLGIAKARSMGVSTVLVRDSSHFGAAGSFALMCAEQGMIGMISTNGPLSLQVPGTRGANISSGTRAFGVPHQPPIILDISLAPAGTKIMLAAARGEQVPAGWIVDAEGRPTTNPENYLQGGARVPIGAHKGYGLALINELMAGALTGAALAWEIGAAPGRDDQPWNAGHMIVTLDVETFMPAAEFAARVHEVATRVASSALIEAGEPIRLPGEGAASTEGSRLRDGIPVASDDWTTLRDSARGLGLVPELEAARVS